MILSFNIAAKLVALSTHFSESFHFPLLSHVSVTLHLNWLWGFRAEGLCLVGKNIIGVQFVQL